MSHDLQEPGLISICMRRASVGGRIDPVADKDVCVGVHMIPPATDPRY